MFLVTFVGFNDKEAGHLEIKAATF